ncbi:hypothetical protein WMY93_024705 [Mugilogobius chulae]|uniref:Spindle assembly abnormal protein 6 homolog n=1 Tax=Mugilogobius chulae TaxID=88201 RepID=A0AAW0NAT1_9GOBI
MEQLFSKALSVSVRSRDSEERKSTIRVTIDLQLSATTVHKRTLCVRLTDDKDPYFLFTLSISEEDFQSLKVQQGLLVDFGSFPQKFIGAAAPVVTASKSPTAPGSCCSCVLRPPRPGVAQCGGDERFQTPEPLSLRLSPGSDREVKDYLASCLSRLKEEKEALELRLKRTEEDLSRQLSCTQQTLCEKSKELDKLRSEWTDQPARVQPLLRGAAERERERTGGKREGLELQRRLQEQSTSSGRSWRTAIAAALRSFSPDSRSWRLPVENSLRGSTRNESSIRDLRMKLVAAEEESQRSKQQVLSLRRDNGVLDSQCHEKERALNQLQMRTAVIKDIYSVLMCCVPASIEENAEAKDLQIKKLEKEGRHSSRSEKRTSRKKEGREGQQQIRERDQQVCALKDQLESTLQKLNESREVLKTNENVISWLNKQLNERQLSDRQVSRATPLEPSSVSAAGKSPLYPVSRVTLPPVGGALSSPADLRGTTQLDPAGLDSKYFERMDSIPIYGLTTSLPNKDVPRPVKASLPSAYFSA